MDIQLDPATSIPLAIKAFDSLNAEWKNLFGNSLSNYLNDQAGKYYYTNTFIHRNEKIKLEDIYYPIKATYKDLTTDFDNLNDVFIEYKKITIIGSAGSGKTTLLKKIFLQIIKNKFKIPILIELRNLNDYNGDFEEFLLERVLKVNVKPNNSTLNRALKKGCF